MVIVLTSAVAAGGYARSYQKLPLPVTPLLPNTTGTSHHSEQWDPTSIMESRTTLPLDILQNIIDLLVDGNDGNIKPLLILSQTSKSMVPLCRKHLFSNLKLLRDLKSERFANLISKNPDIARYVKSLTFTVYNPISDDELNILDLLKKRSSLQTIILQTSGMDWNDFPESMQTSIVSLIQLPTISRLCLESFKGFPATAISGCSNLMHLDFRKVELAPPEVNHVIPRSKISKLETLHLKKKTYSLAALLNSANQHEGGPIVDFSRLQKALFDVESRSEIDLVNEVIKVTTRLDLLYLNTCVRGE
jgi:hypothetical protein